MEFAPLFHNLNAMCMKQRMLFLLGVFFSLQLHAQLQSPDQFLGYLLGSRFTPHWMIVRYYQHVAEQMPGKVKLVEYGRTPENRPLMVAYVTSESLLPDLDRIRRNNLRLANIALDRMAPNEEAPAVVWLSYNVHGNEASSSEASMLTLYSLLDPKNQKAAEWLQKTIIIMDPCVNPDGRDRYVHWYTSVSGKNPNPIPYSREHREPWPGGRTNHYYFDLNRDWAWQTQKETQQRMELYLQWMPQVHVDYHEQGINAPYYFPPAAEPYHEVITEWQRNFQQQIGQNHARYFDRNGWLFFTRKRFDLLYPSYGDTYPTFNGAIGMTYEQGGIGGGLSVYTATGDSLTLRDRLQHHHITGMSTIEICAAQSDRLVKEYRKYFNKAVSEGYGVYKTFIIQNRTGDEDRIRRLTHLLDRNGIRYQTGSGAAKGYRYATGKEEAFTIGKKDILISAVQPRSALVQVLFEPQTRLTDSATYDITAWSLPFAYGLNAFACKQKLIAQSAYVTDTIVRLQELNAYGYAIPWKGIASAKAAGFLLQKGLLLRYNELPFETGGKKFGRGTILVLKSANRALEDSIGAWVREACTIADAEVDPLKTGMVDSGDDFGADLIQFMKFKRVVLVSGEGINANALGSIWHFFDQELNYPVSIVSASDIHRINWPGTDVLILADGHYSFLNEKDKAKDLRGWIEQGGKLIALEGATAELAHLDWGIKAKKKDESTDKKEEPYAAVKNYSERERDELKELTPGSIYEVALDTTHPLAFGCTATYYSLKQDDSIYEFFKDNGWNVGIIKKQGLRAGFVGNKLKEKLQDGLLFGVQNIGKGSVVYLTDDLLFRSFWESGKQIFCNAIFFD